MTTRMKSGSTILLIVLASATLLSPVTAEADAKLSIINRDSPGIGFNDPTPATPVGGNSGTTIGEQRLIAFQKAADLWGAVLDSDVEIRIQANFAPLECSANEGVLGSAGPLAIEADHPGAPDANTWYHIALANRQAGEDRDPAGNDIIANFNGDLGKPNCLAGASWYYGLDANGPDGSIDLVVVLLHEFAHGLGFSEFMNDANGSFIEGIPDAYSRHLIDNTSGLTFVEMTNSQRRAALTSRNLAWTGPAVVTTAPLTLNRSDPPIVTVDSPAAVAGNYTAGRANFGPRAFPGFSGTMVLAEDAANGEGPSTTDGCTALTNAAAVSGKIALIDRGDCPFVTKVMNAQNAGAIGVIILDNVEATVQPAMGGKNAAITIPALSLTRADGNKIRAQLGAGVTGSAREIESAALIGADTSGRPAIYAPSPIEPGSSTSHWDTSATPNLLMEPSINSDLVHLLDLTTPHFVDVGWFAAAGVEVSLLGRTTGNQTGPPEQGDTIRYEVEIAQTSGSAATSVRLTSILDENLTLLDGSVLSSKGEIVLGNQNGDGTVEILLGGLKPGESASIKFDTTLNDDAPTTTTAVSSSITVSGTNFTGVTKSVENAVTVKPVNPMTATKTVSLVVDADGSGSITRGDTLRYQINLDNTGAILLSSVVVTDVLDANLSTVEIVNQSSGTVTQGSTPGETTVVWEVPIVAGVTETLIFDVLLAEDTPTRTVVILNQATVSGTGFEATVTDNPATAAPLDATGFGIEQPRKRGTRR